MQKRLGAPKRKTGWSLAFSKCQHCERTDRPHKARGLCVVCYTYQHGVVPYRKKIKAEKKRPGKRKVKKARS